MSAPLLYPKFKSWKLDGTVNAGGKVFTYQTGTSTPLTTYVDGLLTQTNANPVILDAYGEAPIYVGPVVMKVAIQDAAGNSIVTVDPYSPFVAYPSPAPSEWILLLNALTLQPAITTYLSPTTMQVNSGADQSTLLSKGRRIRTQNTSGYITSTITAISYGAGVNTITVVNDAGTVLDAGLSSLWYGILSYSSSGGSFGSSYMDPRTALYMQKNPAQTGFVGFTKVVGWTAIADPLGEWNAANNRWVCRYPGPYQIQACFAVQHTLSANVSVGFAFYKNGSAMYTSATFITPGFSNTAGSFSIEICPLLNANDYIEIFVVGDANMQVMTPTVWTIVRVP